MVCFLCKKNNFQLVYKLKSKNILHCRNDGLFLAETTVASKNNLYQKKYFDNLPHPPKSNQSYFLKKLAAIKRLTRNESPHILDVGCGWGGFEEVLEKGKIPYLGIDASKEAVEICRKKELNCKQSTIEQLIKSITNKHNDSGVVPFDCAQGPPQNDPLRRSFSEASVILASGARPESFNKFDCITLFQVVEHLNNPLPLLQSAKKLLKKNGVILITTPNNDSPLRKIFGSRWSVYNEPSHFVFYNKKTLSKTISLGGFQNVQTRIDNPRFLSLSYILTRVKQMYFPTFNFSLLNFNFPVSTDPFGDLEATATMNYD